MKVQPEFSLPKASQDGKKLEWTQQNLVHLFWGIKRQDKSDEEWNCQLQYRDVVPVVAAPPVTGSTWKSEPVTETFCVRVPYIVNTVRVDPDKELILKWQMLVKEKRKTPERTWVDDVSKTERKRARGTR